MPDNSYIHTQIPMINLIGETLGATVAGSSAAIKVLLKDNGGDILFAKGVGVPTDTTTGYSKGCIFIDTDASATCPLYVNIGDETDCEFIQLGLVS